MPNPLNLLPNAVNQGQSKVLYAEVAAPAPATFADPLYVVFPDWAPDLAMAITDWPAVHGNALPLVGNSAMISTDSRGIYRCVWWDGPMVFATGSSTTYYLTPTASDVPAHLKLTPYPYSPQTAQKFTNLSTGETLLDYVTEPTSPGMTFFPAGQYEFHIHAQQTAGNQLVRMYAEFWEFDPATNDHIKLIGASQKSEPLTGSIVEYRLFFENYDVYYFASPNNRVSVHLDVEVGGSGGANVTYYVGGDGGGADSHVVLPTNGVDGTTFTRRPQRAYRNGALAYASAGVWQKIMLDARDVANSAAGCVDFDLSTYGAFVVPVAGIYRAMGRVEWVSGAGTTQGIAGVGRDILSSGDVEGRGTWALSTGATSVSSMAFVQIACSRGDVIYLWLWTQSSALTISPGLHFTYLEVERVG